MSKTGAKKIGAIIALDGEKEFKQSVTNCGKTLASLKSEMSLVKAETEGQANSLESLRKKHEVLTKTLEAQKDKEEAVRAGLEHAQKSYDTMGEKLDGLRKKLETATKELEEMRESSDTTAEQLKKQQDEVEALSLALSKSEANYQKSANRVKDWETKLNTAEAQVIKANSALNKNAVYLREAEAAADHCATSIDKFGKEVKEAEEITVDFGTIVKTNLGNTVVNALKDAVVQAVSGTNDLETAQRQLQASTGASAVEMQRYKSIMDELHNNDYGDDINDVAKSMELVKQYTGEIDPTGLKELTENGIALRDVFDMELGESIRGVDALVTNMGVSAETAFDLVAKGAQNGLNKSGELTDNLAEYSQLWGQAGFSAKEMFAILDNGLQSGAYNLDKVNDFVKEFSLSLADGRIEENMDSFSEGTKTLFYQWKAGKATTKDVFYSVINDLSNAKNKQEALTLASNVWSAVGEDNAMSVITSLTKVNTSYDNVKGTMEEIKDIKYDTLESRLRSLGKRFQTEIGTPIIEKAFPVMEKGLDTVIENLDTIIPLMGGIGAGVVAFKTITTAISLYESATVSATVAQEGLNLVQKANPYILVASAITAASAALLTYVANAGEASQELQTLTDVNKKVCDSANKVSQSTGDMIVSYQENSRELKAQTKYAEILADKIKALAEDEQRTNAETEVMKEYISQLNSVVPNLNLAYDEQSKKLNLTNDEIEKNIKLNKELVEQQAAQEYAIELIKQKTELEIEAVKLEQQKAELEKEEKKIRDDKNLSMMDENRAFKELTEAYQENSLATEENIKKTEALKLEEEATKAKLEEFGVSMDDVTGKAQENTAAMDANAQAAQNNGAAQESAAGQMAASAQTIVETYTGMQQTVSEVLESQMDMFEKFDAGTKISSENLLANMQSQIDGVENWSNSMAILAERGINQGILDKLAEMGPEGANYVQAFAQMSDEQLQQASEMWKKSLDMKEGVDASVQGMIDQYTISLSGGKERVAEAMAGIGVDISSGLGNGIRTAINQGVIAVDELGTAVITTMKTKLDSHSPSKVFIGIGRDVTTGLALGISGTNSQVSASIMMTAQNITKAAQSALNQEKFLVYGENIVLGLVEGIRSEKHTVVSEMISVTQLVTMGAASMNNQTLYYNGLNVSYGLASGIRNGKSQVINAVADVCRAAVLQAKRELKINSPSKVFEEIGGYTAQGFEVGYERKMQDVNTTIAKSIEIPRVEERQSSVFTIDNEEMLEVLHEYLPYLKTIAAKEMNLYPSRRHYEKEIAGIADRRMEVNRKRAGMG